MQTTKSKPTLEVELMYVWCAYCGHPIGNKQGPIHMISHGICKECFKKLMEKLDNNKKV